MTNRLAYIYALVDPRNGEIRYVGKSVDPPSRLRAHLKSEHNTGKHAWFADLERHGYEPRLVIVWSCRDDPREWRPLERLYIDRYLEIGQRLLNIVHRPVR